MTEQIIVENMKMKYWRPTRSDITRLLTLLDSSRAELAAAKEELAKAKEQLKESHEEPCETETERFCVWTEDFRSISGKIYSRPACYHNNGESFKKYGDYCHNCGRKIKEYKKASE